MNNSQFRRLVQENSSRSDSASSPSSRDAPSATPALGSRQRSSIPMTPRSLGLATPFQQQLRDANGPAQKKFKSAAAPKGSKLASGYTDRAQLLRQAEEQNKDDKEARIKALEEMVKLGQMEKEDFERVRDDLVGGDLGTTHLVKGLDRKLLEKIRRGDDLSARDEKETTDNSTREEEVDEQELEDELEDLEKRDVKPITKEERVKRGEMAPPPKKSGQKRSRNDILRELKESRMRAQEQKAATEPSLGSRFKKIGDKQASGPRIEVDELGREVLITVDEDGNVKRKIRKNKAAATNLNKSDQLEDETHGLLTVNRDLQPLGMEAPLASKTTEAEPEDDGDIFADAGADYDPLGNIQDDSASSSDESDNDKPSKDKPARETQSHNTSSNAQDNTDSQAIPQDSVKRDYFATGASKKSPSPEDPSEDPFNKANLASVLKKASAIADRVEGSSSNTELSAEQAEAEAAKIKRRKEMLASIDRDADDMDLREDEEDDGAKVLSWDGKSVEGGDKKQQRKRGGKKKQGNPEDIGDVMKVLEGRRKTQQS